MSSIYLTHPQYHDAGVYGGDSGGSGEIKMSDGYVLSDEILKHKINGSAFDHVYPYNASSSLNDLDVFTKGQPFDLYKELREKAPVYFHNPMPTDPEPGYWVFNKYEDIKYVSMNPKIFSSQYTIWKFANFRH